MILNSPPWALGEPVRPVSVAPPSADHMGDWRRFLLSRGQALSQGRGDRGVERAQLAVQWAVPPSAPSTRSLHSELLTRVKAARPTMTVVGGPRRSPVPTTNSWPAYFASDCDQQRSVQQRYGMRSSVHCIHRSPIRRPTPRLCFTGCPRSGQWALSNTQDPAADLGERGGASNQVGAASWRPQSRSR